MFRSRPPIVALVGVDGSGKSTQARRLAIARALSMSRFTGRIAIMDRYAYCQYALVRARGDGGERRLRRLFRCFPRPDVIFLLEVAPATAQRRVELRGRDREELTYLEVFAAAYRQLPEYSTFQVIDANADPDAVQLALRAALVDAALWSRPSGRCPRAPRRGRPRQ